MGYQHFCTNLQNRACFFLKLVKVSICYDQKHKHQHKHLSMISTFLQNLQNRAHFSEPVNGKWVQIVVCYDQNLQKHKYLSMISTFLHKTFRTGLVFLSWSKWVQIVVCYDQNLQKHKYLSTLLRYQHFCTKPYKNINISVGYQCFWLWSKWVHSGMLWSKLTKT